MNKVKESAYRCLKDIKYKVDYCTIADYLKTKGYVTILYDKNQENELLDKLGLSDYSKTVSAFTVRQNDMKFVFVDSSASSEDKLYLLLHETGHILLNHMNTNELTVNLRLQEIEADAFAYEVLNYKNSVSKTIALSALAISTVLLVADMTIRKNIRRAEK